MNQHVAPPQGYQQHYQQQCQQWYPAANTQFLGGAHRGGTTGGDFNSWGYSANQGPINQGPIIVNGQWPTACPENGNLILAYPGPVLQSASDNNTVAASVPQQAVEQNQQKDSRDDAAEALLDLASNDSGRKEQSEDLRHKITRRGGQTHYKFAKEVNNIFHRLGKVELGLVNSSDHIARLQFELRQLRGGHGQWNGQRPYFSLSQGTLLRSTQGQREAAMLESRPVVFQKSTKKRRQWSQKKSRGKPFHDDFSKATRVKPQESEISTTSGIDGSSGSDEVSSSTGDQLGKGDQGTQKVKEHHSAEEKAEVVEVDEDQLLSTPKPDYHYDSEAQERAPPSSPTSDECHFPELADDIDASVRDLFLQ